MDFKSEPANLQQFSSNGGHFYVLIKFQALSEKVLF